MVIGGYTDPQGSRTGFGALLLGVYDDGKLRYAGKVGTGFDDATLRKLAPELSEARSARTRRSSNPPRGFEAKGAHWMRPDLVAEVAFTEWSDDGALRHPSFQGLRLDKKATEVVRERAQGVRQRPAGSAGAGAGGEARSTTRSRARPQAPRKPSRKPATRAGSQPREARDASGREARSRGRHRAVASGQALLPGGRDHQARSRRSITPPSRRICCRTSRDGRSASCAVPTAGRGSASTRNTPIRPSTQAVARIEVPEGKGTATYLSAGSAAALVGLVQWGVIEMHPWGSRAPRLDRPDRLIFDFDPDDDVRVEGARRPPSACCARCSTK